MPNTPDGEQRASITFYAARCAAYAKATKAADKAHKDASAASLIILNRTVSTSTLVNRNNALAAAVAEATAAYEAAKPIFAAKYASDYIDDRANVYDAESFDDAYASAARDAGYPTAAAYDTAANDQGFITAKAAFAKYDAVCDAAVFASVYEAAAKEADRTENNFAAAKTSGADQDTIAKAAIETGNAAYVSAALAAVRDAAKVKAQADSAGHEMPT